MRKFNTEKYITPTEKEIEEITEKIKPRKDKLYEYGLKFGIGMICVSCMLFLLLIGFLSLRNPFSFICPLIILYAGICSLIGGVRSKKEADCIECGEFGIRKGKVKEVQKRNCWSTIVEIEFEKTEETEKLSFIGKPAEKGDLVYIVLANKEKIKWAIPRICKR